MARYRGSVCKLSRSVGVPLDGYPKTERMKRTYGPGQHGQARKKPSEYALQLQEKQKVRYTYGLSEKQFRKYYDIAQSKKGVTGTVFLQRLESRLDNILYRSGLVMTRPQSRQAITHGHIRVNGRKVDIPSYIMKIGDEITIREASKKFIRTQTDSNANTVSDWLDVDDVGLSVRFKALPERSEIDQSFKEQLIIEYYSR